MRRKILLAIGGVLAVMAPGLGQQVVVSYDVSFRFADAEVPAGTVDGKNASLSLANVPLPAASLILTRNGLVLQQGVDYTLNGTRVAFTDVQIPQTGDVVLAWYRYAK